MSIETVNVFICNSCEYNHYWDFLTGKEVGSKNIPEGSFIPVAACCSAVEKFGTTEDSGWCSSSPEDDDEWQCSF